MRRYLFRRFIYSIFAIVGVTIIVFGLSRIAGDPRSLLVSEGGYGISADAWEEQGRKLHLDRAVPIQYAYWVWDVLHGNLGNDLSDGVAVTKKIRQKMPATIRLAVVSWVVATAVGIPLGVLSAVKRGTLLDYFARGFAVFGITLPPFYIAIMGILIFAVKLHWVPVAGFGQGLGIPNYVLPVATLSWAAAAGYLRLMRSAMLEVLDTEYVKLARAKGVSNNLVIWRHAVRNSLIVPITVSALLMAHFLTGAVVVEAVFAWPGIGRLAIEAVANNNLNLVVGTTLVFSTFFIVANLLVDVSYVIIDPRIRLS